MRNKIRYISGFLLLLLFISYYGSITLFWHSHKLGYTTIFHSHPYNNPNHTHTAAQYDLIKVLSETAGFVTITGLFITVAFAWGIGILASRPMAITQKNLTFYYFRRGPPAHLSSQF